MRVNFELLKTWSGRRPGHVFKGMHLGKAKTLQTRGIGTIVECKPKPKTKRKPKAKKKDDDLQSDSNDRAS